VSVEQLITAHLDIWTAADTEKKSGRGRSSGSAGSVYGVKKLRELILELAVRGKLVPQDASDEPASELLKRIATEKANLIAEGKIKKSKPLAEITDDEKPFELPINWKWAKLGLIGYTQTGATPSKSNPEYFGSDIPFIKPGDIYPNYIEYSNEGLSFYGAEKSGRIATSNSLLMVCIGTIGKCNLVQTDCSFNQQINSVTPYIFNSNFLLAVCRSVYFNAEAWNRSSSTTIAILNKGNWEEIYIPIPPLAEQHRIVAKVDELMALCDQLENQHNNAAEAHEKLVTHLLGTLTQSQNAEDFNTNWQRISEHFDTLFTTEASIDALKQTLLQLAVIGKLVPQDHNDEPASELLKRIQAEKAKLIAEGKIKKDKPLAEITEEEKPFELPVGWEWARLSELIAGMDSGWSPACLENKSPSDNDWGVLKTTAVQIMQYLEQENKELPDKLTPRPEAEAKVGDILFTRAGPINRVAISCLVEATRKKLMISDKIIRFHPIETGIDGHFLVLCLNTGATASYLEKAKSGMAASQVNISQEKLRSAPIPLPPLKIQKLIVSKVVEMTAICDHLKGRLTESNELQQKLADTLVEQAI
jgi:type I restriction enzyme S subunit